MTIRIATRRSPLALWQAVDVATRLEAVNPGVATQLVELETGADKALDVTIKELGGKGAFCKEVQALVLAGEADIAVHSAKDLQAITPEGLVVGAIPPRGEARDALVGARLEDLPDQATVATGSQRRQVQLAEIRPDINFVSLRGNIATRLGQLDRCDALIMAAVALERLELDLDAVDVLAPEIMLPQVGQGALAIECRTEDHDLQELLASIDHTPSRLVVEAERDFLIELGGDCDLPAGAHAELVGEDITIVGILAAAADDPVSVQRSAETAPAGDRPGRTLARRLRARLA